MFNKNIKLVISALIIAYSCYQFYEGNIGNGIFLILLSSIFVFLYFRNEMILLAFLRMRKQDLTGTQKWLDKISSPESALTKKTAGLLQLPAWHNPFPKEFDPGRKVF